MKVWTIAAAACLAAGSAFAQAHPAETPPPGFAGARYVDSAGCVYVRVGNAWAQGITASGTPVCGQEPSLSVASSSRGFGPPVPVHVIDGILVPHGYLPAWTDGRTNPERGPRTAAGNAQTAAIWTTTVPRMLVAPDTRGAVLAGPGPAFVYAGHFSSQAAAMAAVDALPRSARAQVARVPSTGHFIVLLGPYANRDAARTGLDIAHDAGLEPSIIR